MRLKITLRFANRNDRLRAKQVRLEPSGIPPGSRLNQFYRRQKLWCAPRPGRLLKRVSELD